MREYKKELTFIGVIIALSIVGSIISSFLNVEAVLNTFGLYGFIENNYVLSVLMYIVVMAIATSVLALPGTIFAFVSSLLFGAFWGTVWCVIAASIGAIGSFVVARYFLADTLRPKLEQNKLLKEYLYSGRIENEIILLAITRLIPVFPFNVQNFFYGLTNIKLSTYSLFTFLFLIPGTAIYTYMFAGIIDESSRVIYFIVCFVFLALSIVLAYGLKKRYKIDQNQEAHK
ncbi:MAG: TVP38/TMEM64 family protein [Coriobacteriia bacterium]|nr:TVP38/TMEM64 family protein [Coriobacteriia bacterium]